LVPFSFDKPFAALCFAVAIQASASLDPTVATTGRIEIELSSGHRITAKGGFNMDALARLLKGLSS